MEIITLLNKIGKEKNMKKQEKNLEGITDETRVWSPNLDIVMPVYGRDIPKFKQWVNWSGWRGYSEDHEAVDFACYLNEKGECILGLPEQTPVRAVADGYVAQVSRGLTREFRIC